MSLLDDLLADLTAEGDALRAVVTGLDPDDWATPTPAPGWSVARKFCFSTRRFSCPATLPATRRLTKKNAASFILALTAVNLSGSATISGSIPRPP